MAIGTSDGEYYEHGLAYELAMNDNTPKIEITVPNISGGLSKPPKPANDNDPRKPMKAGESIRDYGPDVSKDPVARELAIQEAVGWIKEDPTAMPSDVMLRKGVPYPKVDISNLPTSKNIRQAPYDTLQDDIDLNRAEVDEFLTPLSPKLSKDIGLDDIKKRADEGVRRAAIRKINKEAEFKKHWAPMNYEKRATENVEEFLKTK
jgi:hypothetical protein